MRSGESVRDEDRTTRARIRDAAITLFSQDGVAATSVRAIAAAAGVSPALVIHHFGSKDALRVECDQYMVATLHEQRATVMQAGVASFDPLAALGRMREGPPVTRYLARTLVDGSPHVAELIDAIVVDGARAMADGVETGMLRPSAYHYERAAVLTIWSLGALVLHEHLKRLIDVDFVDGVPEDPTAMAPYVGPVIELMTEGLMAPELAARMRTLIPGRGAAEAPTEEEES
ncbi:MAG TPA: TetR family transcriptional regulator [Euzebyales bacterium]|nr:TetR family transcriptional regulator [Euzebyales bacterium]